MTTSEKVQVIGITSVVAAGLAVLGVKLSPAPLGTPGDAPVVMSGGSFSLFTTGGAYLVPNHGKGSLVHLPVRKVNAIDVNGAPVTNVDPAKQAGTVAFQMSCSAGKCQHGGAPSTSDTITLTFDNTKAQPIEITNGNQDMNGSKPAGGTVLQHGEDDWAIQSITVTVTGGTPFSQTIQCGGFCWAEVHTQ